jgi:hypothetical protein
MTLSLIPGDPLGVARETAPVEPILDGVLCFSCITFRPDSKDFLGAVRSVAIILKLSTRQDVFARSWYFCDIAYFLFDIWLYKE